jgi:hypothetical protein
MMNIRFLLLLASFLLVEPVQARTNPCFMNIQAVVCPANGAPIGWGAWNADGSQVIWSRWQDPVILSDGCMVYLQYPSYCCQWDRYTTLDANAYDGVNDTVNHIQGFMPYTSYACVWRVNMNCTTGQYSLTPVNSWTCKHTIR